MNKVTPYLQGAQRFPVSITLVKVNMCGMCSDKRLTKLQKQYSGKAEEYIRAFL